MKLSYHPVKFDGHRHSGSGDIMILGCSVTLYDYVIKTLHHFIE